uniref:Uncharacterized protein n=1 Tax=Eucampia antarctica TaxID=49252 RepID=A0A6U0TBK4_9STRA|mmetsp:Transcript_5459/g.5110  ORF Transcript_5459/g.5110 Transcript_5459/m.5110 type:complete len:198 (+) Transcript_5459:33-626(+)|eukprot:CAMPEP_0197837986 /NCGR_PEP_ID=MMETSP1437-20131217/33958_1 /TAXON_ID=49252 ORGANISM="Eucampia antarctica, Strain CCMP1452" /NCGR_SAMPLE_ID=MMETSP1437 /ASSEMBLY_ACC=CAM_ASM_001096 /LENGTH=197 /DNA_ID=CAMNT_0043445481 /DNA_START=30 /DNA_END=623 /DNA_ORIENTATION=+
MMFLTGLFVAAIKLASLSSIEAFAVERPNICRNGLSLTVCDAHVSRRNFVSVGTAAVLAYSSNVAPALADVSDGNKLPQGAEQFSRLLKAKKALEDVTKRVAENTDELDKKEWDNLSDFIRVLYKSGEDMKIVSKGIFDPEKKKKADEYIKFLQKLSQTGDEPISKQDRGALLAIFKKSAVVFDQFFELLRDVPDEI